MTVLLLVIPIALALGTLGLFAFLWLSGPASTTTSRAPSTGCSTMTELALAPHRPVAVRVPHRAWTVAAATCLAILAAAAAFAAPNVLIVPARPRVRMGRGDRLRGLGHPLAAFGLADCSPRH